MSEDSAPALPVADPFAFARHELRNPVNAILGYAEMLLEDTEGTQPELAKDLERITTAGRRLLRMVDEFLSPQGSAALSALPAAPNGTEASDLFSASLDGWATVRASDEDLVAADDSASETGFLLIVDDDEHNRDLLVRRLERQGHRVQTASNGRHALEILRSAAEVANGTGGRIPFDLVLLDLIMPEMDGLQTLQHLKAEPVLRSIPVIMLSALNEVDSVVRCIEMGADDYLPKPFDTTLLRARIGSSLKRKQLQDQERAYLSHIQREKARADALLRAVIPIGMVLSGTSLASEREFNLHMEKLVSEAKSFCGADSAALYMRGEDDRLRFVLGLNDTLEPELAREAYRSSWPTHGLPLKDPETGLPNLRHPAVKAVLTGDRVELNDVYSAGVGESEPVDATEVRAFDRLTGYRSVSLMAIALKNARGRVVGVLQLVNALDADTGMPIAFDSHTVAETIQAVAQLAATAVETYTREQRLHRQIADLRVEIDQARRQRQVAEITETDYFQDLQRRARQLRRRQEERESDS